MLDELFEVALKLKQNFCFFILDGNHPYEFKVFSFFYFSEEVVDT